MASKPRIVFGPAVIASLLKDKRYQAEFPFLQNPPKIITKKSIGCCGSRRSVEAETVDYNALKRKFAELPKERKALLKQLLDAKQIVVSYNDGHGVKTLKF
jgi:hypothetical protein